MLEINIPEIVAEVTAAHDRYEIAVTSNDVAVLDELFWDDTTWLAADAGGELRAVVLLLDKLRIPILYAVAPWDEDATRALLQHARARLPARSHRHPILALPAKERIDRVAARPAHGRYANAPRQRR